MPDVTGAEIPVLRRHRCDRRIFPGERIAQQLEQAVQRRTPIHRHVVYLIDRLGIIGRRREEIRLNGIGDKTEVAARFAVAVDQHLLAEEHRFRPQGDDRGVGALWILSRTKHVEVAQADWREAVQALLAGEKSFLLQCLVSPDEAAV